MKEDLKLRLNVEGELDADPGVDQTHIKVAAQNGVVTLTGTIHTFAEKMVAVRAVQRAAGGCEVIDSLQIRLAQEQQRTDAEIIQAAHEAFWLVPHQGEVRILSEDGWVTLEGEVKWQFQRLSAQESVAHLLGVKGVTNLITLKPQEQPHLNSSDIEASIKRAFERRSALDAEQVRVQVVDGHVTLSGHLASWGERQEAARAARNVAGVTSVHNHISFGLRI